MFDQAFWERLLSTPTGAVFALSFFLMVATMFIQAIGTLRKPKNGNGHDGSAKALEIAMSQLERDQKIIDQLIVLSGNDQVAINALRTSMEMGFQTVIQAQNQAGIRHEENRRGIQDILSAIPQISQLRQSLLNHTAYISGEIKALKSVMQLFQRIQADIQVVVGSKAKGDTGELEKLK